MPTLLEERRATRDPEVTVRVVADDSRHRGGSGRRVTLGGMLTTAGLGAVAVAIILLVGAITGFIDIGNPFASTTTDLSPPVLLKQLKNLTDYNAAQGVYEVRVELHNDVPILPDFIAGSKVDFDGIGTVDANINFSKLSTDAVVVNPDHSVTITLQQPKLGRAVVDPSQSKVVSRSAGLVDRIARPFEDNPTSERDLYLRAANKMDKAARESNLVGRAEKNTTVMLKGFLARLGFTNVNVVFEKPAPAAKAK
jgi:hypothetical protein